MTGHAKRKGDIFIDREMFDQMEILQDDTNSAFYGLVFCVGQQGTVFPEHADKTARRDKRQIAKFQ